MQSITCELLKKEDCAHGLTQAVTLDCGRSPTDANIFILQTRPVASERNISAALLLLFDADNAAQQNHTPWYKIEKEV
jgi:hypothetical protein